MQQTWKTFLSWGQCVCTFACVYLWVTHAVRFVSWSRSWWFLHPCFAGNFGFSDQVERYGVLWDYIQQERRHHLPETSHDLSITKYVRLFVFSFKLELQYWPACHLWSTNTSTETRSRRFSYLLSCPQLLRFEYSRRQQFNSAPFVSQSSVHQLSVLNSGEEATSNRHPGTRHHVVLDQACQRFTILETEQQTWAHSYLHAETLQWD